MAELILFNKPHQVLSQFSTAKGTSNKPQQTLAQFINIPNVYPAGRLDYDSEGLLLLTDSGSLQARITQPRFKLPKYYWAQVEGEPSACALEELRAGVELKDGKTRPAQATTLSHPPKLWARTPAIAAHRDAYSSWLNITLTEGRNRQVRRMCAAIGHPVLRLIRHRVGDWQLGDLQPGQFRRELVHLPKPRKR